MSPNPKSTTSHDAELIRPAMRLEEVTHRGRELNPTQRRAVRKALRTLHTLELMAQTIYRYQLTREPSELNRQLIAAMLNEMTHYQDFQVRLYEYGFRPSPWRWAYWLVGLVMGFGSRLLGTPAMLRTGIWVESQAVHHYAQLAEAAAWDDATLAVILKDQADEHAHIRRWQSLLDKSSNTSGS